MRKLFRTGIASMLLVDCFSANGLLAQQVQSKSLYDRLGGKTAISAVVDEFVGRVAADKRINAFLPQRPRIR